MYIIKLTIFFMYITLHNYYTEFKTLHWLPVFKQLEVKDALKTFKCLKGLSLLYLCIKFTTRSEILS